jgi:hypothetical protein
MKRKRSNKLSATDTTGGARAKAEKEQVQFRVVLQSSILTDV